MSKLAGLLGGKAGVSAVAFIGVAAVGAGAYYYQTTARTAAPVVTVAEPAPKAEAPQEAPVAASDQTTPTEESVAAAPTPPRIDEVRLQEGGVLVVAGRAEPGSIVAVLLDGQSDAEAQPNSGGAFAAISVIEPSPDARVISLVQRNPDGTELASLDEVILAPLAAPVVVAEAPSEDAGQEEPAPLVEGPGEDVAPAVVAEAPDEDTAPTDSGAAIATAKPEGTEDTAKAPEATVTAAADDETATQTPAATTGRVAILRSDAEGVSLANPGPAVMDSVALDTISYSDLGDVQLSGRASPEDEVVRVYLNNTSIATLDVAEDGNWRGDLPDVDTGIYTLRIDAVDEAGDVTSRVETPFQREDPVVLTLADEDTPPARAITVQSGTTLWAIARERYGEGTLYVRVFEANRSAILDPDLIYPGQVFELPE